MKTSYGEKYDALLRQYPFLVNLLGQSLLSQPQEEEAKLTRLAIKVQVADGDLLWRTADNIGLPGDNGFLFGTKGEHKGQVGKRGEYLYAIHPDGHILHRVDWPQNRESVRGKTARYGWSVLWRHHDDKGNCSGGFSDNEILCLVWATIESWHEDTESDSDRPGARFGKQVSRHVTYTVFQKPKEGFWKLQENSPMQNHLCLDSQVHAKALFDNDPNILNLFGRLDELCQLFHDDVWQGQMQCVLDSGGVRGASGKFGPVTVLAAEMCGYERVMLQDSACWISFQAREEGGNLYVLGMYGTLPQLRNLVKTVVHKWETSGECRGAFVPDEKVSVL